MARCRIAFILIAAWCVSATGCMALYSTRPVEIIATNAETGQPVANLPVSVKYEYLLVLNAPKEASGVTNANGRVILTVADFSNGDIFLQVGDYWNNIRPTLVRDGGVVTAEMWAAPATTPKITLRLVPQRPSFLDWWLVHGLYGHFD